MRKELSKRERAIAIINDCAEINYQAIENGTAIEVAIAQPCAHCILQASINQDYTLPYGYIVDQGELIDTIAYRAVGFVPRNADDVFRPDPATFIL